MYVCYLIGNDVFRTIAIQCCIPTIDDLPTVKDYIKSKYELEFDEEDESVMSNVYIYHNKSDDRDITLVVERYDIIERE